MTSIRTSNVPCNSFSLADIWTWPSHRRRVSGSKMAVVHSWQSLETVLATKLHSISWWRTSRKSVNISVMDSRRCQKWSIRSQRTWTKSTKRINSNGLRKRQANLDSHRSNKAFSWLWKKWKIIFSGDHDPIINYKPFWKCSHVISTSIWVKSINKIIEWIFWTTEIYSHPRFEWINWCLLF